MSKILLIDDMSSVRAAIAAVLRKDGHEVVEAEDGHAGLEQARQSRFDLVITDIMMPNSDGTDVVFALKEQAGSPPVIAMSGGGSGIPAETALTLARNTADVSLTKPFENAELLNAVGQLT